MISFPKLLILVSSSILVFLFGYLIANYHFILKHDECKGHNPIGLRKGQSHAYSQSVSTYNSSTHRRFFNYTLAKPKLWLEVNPFYRKRVNNIAKPRVLSEVFSMFHHPSSPLTSEVVIHARNKSKNAGQSDLYEGCESVYLTRTGSLANMPNKCLAVGLAASRDVDPIPHSHRRGKISGMINMYQSDFIKGGALKTEKVLLPMLFAHLDSVTTEFLQVTGPPTRADGSKRSIMVMVLNEGVIDVFLNFVCSCKSAGITAIFDDLVVILGQQHLLPVIRQMGVKAFYSPHLGPIPKKAAQFYGDLTFSILMWFKVTSVYLAFKAGFHVLFQDVDLVWMENPLPLLEAMTQHDIIFMDDGAR